MSHRTLLATISVTATMSLMAAMPARADFVINDDLIVDGSACIGFDCVNGESFGFDTIRLKENNLRIKFDDTSVVPNFPSNDWQLTANASANGGANKFSIDDITGNRTPFTVEAGARSHSLYVDDGGRIGIRTSTPSVELHIIDGDTPTVRLQQDGSSGFTPQTWDVAGNETNFFIRDVTNGSQLPFRIRPDAPSNSIYVDADGDVGMGTSSPETSLHVRNTDGSSKLLIEEASGTTDPRNLAEFRNNGLVSFQLTDTSGATDVIWTLQNRGTLNSNEFRITNPVGVGEELILEEDGDMTIAGTLTENSDKNAKMAIEPVNVEEVLAKVTALPVSAWTYKDDTSGARHMGPMAQDFYAMFGLGATETGISTLDTSGVALAAIKALAEENARLLARIEALEAVTVTVD